MESEEQKDEKKLSVIFLYLRTYALTHRGSQTSLLPILKSRDPQEISRPSRFEKTLQEPLFLAYFINLKLKFLNFKVWRPFLKFGDP